MNLFRSEEHARNWSGFNPQAEAGLVTLQKMMTVFSTARSRERFNGRYISSYAGYGPEFLQAWKDISDNDPFWRVDV